jgi:predicted ArsR family transcriptional regulator
MATFKRVDDSIVQEEVLDLISKTPQPVTVSYIASKLDINWLTARAILLYLLAQNKLDAERTTRSWIFRAKRNRAKARLHVVEAKS